MYKIPVSIKALPMILDDSFTPVELINKLAFKINECIDKINDLSQRIEGLKDEITIEYKEYCDGILEQAKIYTDEKIREALTADIITAENFDNLEITAQQFDSLELTAWQYDTASNIILVPPNS